MVTVDVDALRDDQWERLRDLVPGGRAGQRGPWCDNRLFVDALLRMARSGARWRDLPVVLTVATQRMALAADTPKGSAAERRNMPPDTAATSRDRRSRNSGFPMQTGLLPSLHDEPHPTRVGKSPMLQIGQVPL